MSNTPEDQAIQLVKRQFELESWWVEDCKNRSLEYNSMLRRSNRATSDKGLQALLTRSAEALGVFIENLAPSGGNYRKNALIIKEILKNIEPFELAYLILGEAINTTVCSNKGWVSFPAMGDRLAEALSWEFKARAMLILEPTLPKVVDRVLRDSRSSLAHRKRVFVAMFHRMSESKKLPAVFHDHASKVEIGNALVELLLTSPGLTVVKSTKMLGKNKNVCHAFAPSEQVLKIFNRDMDIEMLGRRTTPLGIMLDRPGKRCLEREMLITKDVDPIVSNKLKGKRDVSFVEGDGYKTLLSSLTALEQTPMRVNKLMLQFVRDNQAELTRLGVLEYVPRLDLSQSPVASNVRKDEMSEDEKQRFEEWKAHQKKQYTRFFRDRLKLMKQERTLQLAEKLANYDKFYYRWYADFRGRLYPLNGFLSIQGNSLAKSLLEFGEEVPIEPGNLEDPAWLEFCEYGARLTKEYEKASLEDILEFIASFSKYCSILNGLSIEGIQFEVGDKNVLGYIAWLLEYERLSEFWGKKTTTSHPIRRDATCSSMQHMAAMAGDKKVLKLVNCAPNLDRPQDLYTSISTEAPRAGVKKYVMTLAYNSTEYSRRKDLAEILGDKNLAKAASEVIARDAKKTLGKVLVLQGLLTEVFNEVILKNQLHALSITPTGFVVDSEKWEYPSKRYRIHHFDADVQMMVDYKNLDASLEDLKFRKKDSRNGWVANIIHSLDACLIQLMLNCLKRSSPAALAATVHDCIVTRPGEMGLVMAHLEVAFQTMYEASPSGLAGALDRLVEFWDLDNLAPEIAAKFRKLKGLSSDNYEEMGYFFV